MNDLYKLFNVDLQKMSTYEVVTSMLKAGSSKRAIADAARIGYPRISRVIEKEDRTAQLPFHTEIINAHNILMRGK